MKNLNWWDDTYEGSCPHCNTNLSITPDKKDKRIDTCSGCGKQYNVHDAWGLQNKKITKDALDMFEEYQKDTFGS